MSAGILPGLHQTDREQDVDLHWAAHAIDLARQADYRTSPNPMVGAVLVDGDGREQWLTGVWRTPVLRRALGAYQGASLRGLLNPLDLVRVPVSGPWFDCDTLDDVTRAGKLLA